MNPFDSYEFKSETRSILSPFLKRFWYGPILKMVPSSFHANYLTLVGALLWATGCGLALLFKNGIGTASFLAIAGVLIWMYSTLDTIDGTHARKNGTNGPLGEILDHGLDTFAVFLIPLGLMMALEITPIILLVVIGLASIMFWSTMWELHHTGVLKSGRVTDLEAYAILTTFMVCCGIFGVPVMEAALWAGGPNLIHLMILAACLGYAGQFIGCLFRQRSATLRLQAMPVLLPILLFAGWYMVRPTEISVYGVATLMGLAAAGSTIELIRTRIFHLRYRPIEPVALALASLGLVLLAANIIPTDQIRLFSLLVATVLFVVTGIRLGLLATQVRAVLKSA